ncbi:hypothetical protein KC324_g48 [Hortaea werneckii]|nr:hypothetical protein KC324_g48 [Hortaea werneckii]
MISLLSAFRFFSGTLSFLKTVCVGLRTLAAGLNFLTAVTVSIPVCARIDPQEVGMIKRGACRSRFRLDAIPSRLHIGRVIGIATLSDAR